MLLYEDKIARVVEIVDQVCLTTSNSIETKSIDPNSVFVNIDTIRKNINMLYKEYLRPQHYENVDSIKKDLILIDGWCIESMEIMEYYMKTKQYNPKIAENLANIRRYTNRMYDVFLKPQMY